MFTPHQSLSRRIFACASLAPLASKICFRLILTSRRLPNERTKRRTSINSYLVQRQTEWNWSIPSRVEHERKERERIRAICVFLSVIQRRPSTISPRKRFIFIARSPLDIKRRIKHPWWSSKDSRTSLPFVRSNFSLKNGGEDVYPVKYRKIYSKGCRLGPNDVLSTYPEMEITFSFLISDFLTVFRS